MLVIRERRERNPRFDRPSATGQLQTLGRGGRLGPVPTGLLGSVKEAVLGSRRPVDQHMSQPGTAGANGKFSHQPASLPLPAWQLACPRGQLSCWGQHALC